MLCRSLSPQILQREVEAESRHRLTGAGVLCGPSCQNLAVHCVDGLIKFGGAKHSPYMNLKIEEIIFEGHFDAHERSQGYFTVHVERPAYNAALPGEFLT